MLDIASRKARSCVQWVRGKTRRAARNEDGATAVEFGLIIVPFMMFLIGSMSVCLYYFTSTAVEEAVWKASRDMRTAQYQQGLGPYANLTGDTLKNAFKQTVCNNMPSFINCTSSVRVLVQSATTDFRSATIVQPVCLNGGDLITDTAANASFNAGGSGNIVLITACVAWQFGGHLTFLSLGNMNDGSRLIQASFALNIEPY